MRAEKHISITSRKKDKLVAALMKAREAELESKMPKALGGSARLIVRTV